MKRGFSLIEIMTVVSILSFLFVLSFPSYKVIQKNIIFRNEIQTLVDNIKLAQNNALLSQDGERHGVYFESDRYIIYSGDSYGEFHKENIVEFKSGMKVMEEEGQDINFERLTGETINTSIKIGIDLKDQKTIQISKNGKITIN